MVNNTLDVPPRSERNNFEAFSDNTLSDAKEQAFRIVLGTDFGQTLEGRGIKKNARVSLFVFHNNNVLEVGTAKLSPAGDGTEIVQRKLHSHELSQTCNNDLTVITGTCIKSEMSSHLYPYTFKGSEGPPATLKDMFSAGFYAWDTRMMVLLRSSKRLREKSTSPDDNVIIISPPKKRLKRRGESRDLDDVAEVSDVAQVTEKSDSESSDVILISEVTLDNRGREVAVRSFEKNAYCKVEVMIRLPQVLKPPCTLRDVLREHVEELKTQFKRYGYDYGSGLMSVTVRRTENPELPNLDIQTISETEGRENGNASSFLKKNLFATVVDGLHRREAIALLKDEDGQHNHYKWLNEPLKMILIMRKDGNDMSSTELLHLGSQRNQVTSTVRPFHTLEDYIFAVVSYLKSFAEEAKIKVDEVRPSDLAAEMYNSNLLRNLEKDTYRRYARVGKCFAKYPRAFQKLKTFNPNARPKLGLSHLDHSAFFQVDEQGVLLFLDSVDAYVRNPNTSGSFKAVLFYSTAKNLYDICRNLCQKYSAPRSLSFEQFLAIDIKLTKTRTVSIRDHFIRQMRLFSAKNKVDEEKNVDRTLRFENKLKAHFQLQNVPDESPVVVVLSKASHPVEDVVQVEQVVQDEQVVQHEEAVQDEEAAQVETVVQVENVVPSQISEAVQLLLGASKPAEEIVQAVEVEEVVEAGDTVEETAANQQSVISVLTPFEREEGRSPEITITPPAIEVLEVPNAASQALQSSFRLSQVVAVATAQTPHPANPMWTAILEAAKAHLAVSQRSNPEPSRILEAVQLLLGASKPAEETIQAVEVEEVVEAGDTVEETAANQQSVISVLTSFQSEEESNHDIEVPPPAVEVLEGLPSVVEVLKGPHAAPQALRRSSRLRGAPFHIVNPPCIPSHETVENSASVSKKKTLIDQGMSNARPHSERHPLDDLDEECFVIPLKQDDVGRFDDVVPPRLPRGCQIPPLFKGEIDPLWQQAVGLAPSSLQPVLEKYRADHGSIHHTPWLLAVHVPLQHRAHLYADTKILAFFHRLAWCMAAKKQLEWAHERAPGISSFLPENSWKHASSAFKNGEGLTYFVIEGERLEHRGFCILNGFADTAAIPDELRKILQQPPGLSQHSLQELYTHYLSTFPGERNLKDPRNRTLWNPIVNVRRRDTEEINREAGRARYSSTRKLLMEATEQSPSALWASVRRALLDAWVGLLALLLGLKKKASSKMWVPCTGGRFLITGKDCPRQVPHNDFKVSHGSDDQKSPGYFVMVTAEEGFPLWISEYSHHFVFMPVPDLNRIGSSLKLKKIFVPPNSVLFGHGYVTHGGAGARDLLSGTTSTRYHIYLSSANHELQDSVFYSFSDSELQHLEDVHQVTGSTESGLNQNRENIDHNVGSDEEEDEELVWQSEGNQE